MQLPQSWSQRETGRSSRASRPTGTVSRFPPIAWTPSSAPRSTSAAPGRRPISPSRKGESFEVGYVTGKPWSAYNWYEGDLHSLIQVNTELPILIDRAIDFARHEGYPGHHFERDVLYSIAGLDPKEAERYTEILHLVGKLDYAGNTAARRYLDGEIDAAQAADWLVRYALSSPARAKQRVTFFDTYRSYVINYNPGRDLVRKYVEAKSGGDGERRWKVFGELISSPRLPSGLR